MERIICGLLVLVGLIHLLPLSGIFGADRLAALYGVTLEDNSLVLLMRHRAVLFGLLGAYLIGAAFRRAWRPIALVAGFISVLSFLLLAVMSEGYNDAIRSVVIADVVALAALLIALFLIIAQSDSLKSPGAQRRP